MSETPWIVTYDGSNGKPPMQTECLRCGETFTLKLPVSVDVLVAAADAFIKHHRSCEEVRP